jgi:hypothetical protein
MRQKEVGEKEGNKGFRGIDQGKAYEYSKRNEEGF